MHNSKRPDTKDVNIPSSSSSFLACLKRNRNRSRSQRFWLFALQLLKTKENYEKNRNERRKKTKALVIACPLSPTAGHCSSSLRQISPAMRVVGRCREFLTHWRYCLRNSHTHTHEQTHKKRNLCKMDRLQLKRNVEPIEQNKKRRRRKRSNKQISKQNSLPQTWAIPSWRTCCRDRHHGDGMLDKMDGCKNCQYLPNRVHRHRSTGRLSPDRKTWWRWRFAILLSSFFSSLPSTPFQFNTSTLYPRAPIRTASVHRIENHDTRPFFIFVLFCYAQCESVLRFLGWFATKPEKFASGPTAATCRLGSWRPTGEVPLHLGRAMMMMHTSWSLASDTPLKMPVHIFFFLSLSLFLFLQSPRLKHLKPKSFFEQSFILRRLALRRLAFLSLSRSAPFSLSLCCISNVKERKPPLLLPRFFWPVICTRWAVTKCYTPLRVLYCRFRPSTSFFTVIIRKFVFFFFRFYLLD